MSSSLRSSLIKMPIVVLLAASMGWLGLASMYWGSPYFPAVGEFWPNYVMLASVVLWASASIALRGRDKRTWLAFGLVSPLLGAVLVAPPASFAFIIAQAYIAFPIGVATGMAMYFLDVIGRGSDARKLTFTLDTKISDQEHRSRFSPFSRALLFSAVLMLMMGLPAVADDGLGKAASQTNAAQKSVTAEKQNVAQVKRPRANGPRRNSVSRPRAHDAGQIEQVLEKSHQRKGKRRGKAKREQRNRFHVSGSFELVLGDQIKLRGSGAATLDLDQQTAQELLDTINKQLDKVIPLISDMLKLLSGLPKSMESVSRILNFLSPP